MDVAEEGKEEREPSVRKNPSRPTPGETERHTVTHLPFSELASLVRGRKGQGPHAPPVGGLFLETDP